MIYSLTSRVTTAIHNIMTAASGKYANYLWHWLISCIAFGLNQRQGRNSALGLRHDRAGEQMPLPPVSRIFRCEAVGLNRGFLKQLRTQFTKQSSACMPTKLAYLCRFLPNMARCDFNAGRYCNCRSGCERIHPALKHHGVFLIAIARHCIGSAHCTFKQ